MNGSALRAMLRARPDLVKPTEPVRSVVMAERDTAPATPLLTPWSVKVAVNVEPVPPVHVARLSALIGRCYQVRGRSDSFQWMLRVWWACLERDEVAYATEVAGAERRELEIASEAFAYLTEHFWIDGRYADLLGPVYMDLGGRGHRQHLGQFFTPWQIAIAMGQMSVHDLEPKLDAGEVVTANDPACGSGVMMLAFKAAVADRYGRTVADRRVRVSGQDIDRVCCDMARIQLRMSDGLWMSSYMIASGCDAAGFDGRQS